MVNIKKKGFPVLYFLIDPLFALPPLISFPFFPFAFFAFFVSLPQLLSFSPSHPFSSTLTLYSSLIPHQSLLTLTTFPHLITLSPLSTLCIHRSRPHPPHLHWQPASLYTTTTSILPTYPDSSCQDECPRRRPSGRLTVSQRWRMSKLRLGVST